MTEVLNPPAAPALPDLAFADPHNLAEFRVHGQWDARTEARIEVFEEFSQRTERYTNDELNQAIDARVSQKLDERISDHLSSNVNRDDHPEAYEALHDVIRDTAIDRQDSEKWNFGDQDGHGGYVPGTSGREQVEQVLADLRSRFSTPEDGDDGDDGDEPTPVDTPEPATGAPTPETLAEAQQNLEIARNNLAALSVQLRRRWHKRGKSASELRDQYNQAQEIYQNARLRHGILQAQNLQSQNITGVELRRGVIDSVLTEHGNFTTAEQQALIAQADNSRAGRLIRWFANHNKAWFMGASAGAGLGFGWLLGTTVKSITKNVVANTAGFGAAIAIPAIGAGMVGAKVARAVYQARFGSQVELHRSITDKATKDQELLRKELNDTEASDHEELLSNSQQTLTNRINTRVNKDIRGNKVLVLGAAALSGAAGGLGYLVAEAGNLHIDKGFHTIWPFDHADQSNSTSGGGAAGSGGNGSGGAIAGGNAASHNLNYNDTIPPNQSNPGLPSADYQQPYANPNGLVDGFNPNVIVENGHGYIQELQELAAQKNIHLTDQQGFNLYHDLLSKYNGPLLDNDPSYTMPGGGLGISHPGQAVWDPNAVHFMNQWLQDHASELSKSS